MSWQEPEIHHERTSPESGWHPVNVAHLVMGVALLGLFTVWVLVVTDTFALADHRWLLPAPWILAGIVGLAASALKKPHRT